jgi:hypothetical protein
MKFLELVVLGSLLVVLTGCPGGGSGSGSSGGGSANPTPTPTPTPAPTVSSIAPTAGPIAGGTAVTVTGTNFFSAVTVKINGVVCTGPAVVNSTSITCTTPAQGPGGPYTVSVQTGSGTGTSGAIFTYTSAPIISSISPLYGAVGSTITVTGNNFSAAGLAITINGVACSASNYTSATQVSCTVPAGLTNLTSYSMTVFTTAAGTSAAGGSFMVRAIPATASHLYGYNLNTCAIMVDGSVNCWGASPYTPTVVMDSTGNVPLLNVTKVSVGTDFSCAIIAGGTVQCWGTNKPDASAPNTTTVIPGLAGVSQIAVGDLHLCALIGTNVSCLGNNFWGQLSDGNTTNSTTAVSASIANVTGISAGGNSTCFISGGDVYCAGADYQSNTAGTVVSTPTLIPGLNVDTYANLSSSSRENCVQDSTTQGLICWGSIFYNGTPSASGPTSTAIAANFVPSSSDFADCVLLTSGANTGSIACHGYNNSGQLGNGNTTNSLGALVYVRNSINSANLTGMTELAGTCALGGGTVWCWGIGTGLGQAGPPAFSDLPVNPAAWQ